MTQRFYLRAITDYPDNPGDVNTSPLSAVLPVGTDATSDPFIRWRELAAAAGTGLAADAESSVAQTAHQDGCMGAFYSEALSKQNIPPGNWTTGVQVDSGAVAGNPFLCLSIYVWRPTTNSVVAYIYDSDTALGTEFPTSPTGRIYTVAGAGVSVAAGDVLCIEYWFHALQDDTGSYSHGIRYNGDTALTDGYAGLTPASYLDAPVNLLMGGFGSGVTGVPGVIETPRELGAVLTLGGRRIDAPPDWSATNNAGGHDQFRGTIPQDQFEAVGWADQGTEITLVSDDGLVIWAGRLSQVPQMIDGSAKLAAQGFKFELDKHTDRLLVQSRDMSIWQPLDGEPFLNANGVPFYPINRKIDVSAGNRIRWNIPKDDQVGADARDGVAFWAEGVNLARLKFVMSYNAADETTDFAIEVRKANGPNGTDSAETSFNTTAGNNGTTKDYTLGATRDMILLNLLANVAHTATASRSYRVSRIWVNSDVNTDDTWSSVDALKYIGTTLGLDNAQLDTIGGSPPNILPFDWQNGSWLQAALYISELEDKAYRVLENRGAGPRHEYVAWGETTWRVSTALGADPDLTPLELYDRVLVTYESPTGILRRATAGPGTPYGNTFEFDLQDRQTDGTLAQSVADKLYARLSVQRYAGTIAVGSAENQRGNTNVYGIRYGDRITITDWGHAQALSLRVMAVEYRPTGVTVHVEQPVNIESLLFRPPKERRRRAWGEGR